MKKKSKYNSISYSCIYCGNESIFSLPKLIAHIDIFHNEISKIDKEEVIRDLNLKLLRKEKDDEFNLIKKKVTEFNENEITQKKKELSVYKSLVVSILDKTHISENDMKLILSRKSIKKLKYFLKYGIKKEFQIYLDEAGIDYYTPRRKKKKKRKKLDNTDKEYFDETINSIIPIYTPMGNKR